MCGDMNSVIAKEGGESEAWREMKDWIEYHSPIPMEAILSSRKTPNQAVNVRENRPRKTTIINHLNHLIDHFNHLNQIGLQDLSQRWQNNTGGFCKHHGKLEADPDSRAEVLHSSSVLLTGIQAQAALPSIPCHHVKCPVNQNPVSPVPGSRFLKSRSCFILLPNHWKELHLV